ncbi:ferredoxin [Patescibacteria group bacterium]|nr:ferredoxin [Patescibacteria group bacterium]
MTKVSVKDNCIGCGLCAQIAANTFAMKDDGKSHVINQEGDPLDTIKEAEAACPVQAIVVDESA